jgi:hypothetical protein
MEATYLCPPQAEWELSPQVELGAEIKHESPMSPAVSPPLEAGALAVCSAHDISTAEPTAACKKCRLPRGYCCAPGIEGHLQRSLDFSNMSKPVEPHGAAAAAGAASAWSEGVAGLFSLAANPRQQSVYM